jgi:putative chitobiose transport system substrate-binding protein
MPTKFALIVLASILLGACAQPTAAPVEPETIVETVVVEVESTKIVEVEKTVEVEVPMVVTPTPGPNPEAVISGVEDGAEITLWTYWLAPTFDEYINSTVARFEETYPGVKVNGKITRLRSMTCATPLRRVTPRTYQPFGG